MATQRARGKLLNLVRRLLMGGWLLPAMLAQWAHSADILTLGVFAYRPKPIVAAHYQPLADYLTAQFTDTKVELRVLSQAEFETALAKRELDLVFTNPSHYLVVRSQYSLTGALATLVNLQGGMESSQLGGVIITRKGRQDIQGLTDLKGKSIAVPGTKFLGGYQTQLYELRQAGVNLEQEHGLQLMGSHDAVVKAVLEGAADVGFIRTGIIEAMVMEGRLEPGRLQVVNRQSPRNFPYAVSTRLYPEWPFVALPHVDSSKVRRIAAGLLALEAGQSVAQAANIAGFDPPADYLPVENLARALRLPPYDQGPVVTWMDIWVQHRPAVVVVLFSMAIISILLTLLSARNRRLAETERYQRALLDNFPFMVWLKDTESRFLAVNQPYADSAGLAYPRELEGKTDMDVWPADVAERHRKDDREIMASGLKKEAEEEVVVQGEHAWFETYKSPVLDVQGKLLGTVGFTRDISARKHAEEKLRLAADVFTHAREGIMITEPDGCIVDVNEAFSRITGYKREEVLGKTPRILGSGRQGADFYAAMWRDIKQKGHWQGEVWNRRKDGEVYAELLTISAVRDAQGLTSNFVSLFSDITALKEHERRLEHIAHYDALTGLPNRVLLADRLRQAMAQERRRGQKLAVAYLDLDGFKAINDTHGHKVGDLLLTSLATALKQVMRDGDTIARLGGDEFVAVMVDLNDARDCVPLLNRLLGAASQPVSVEGMQLQVSASLGVTFYPQADEMEADQLMRQADQAMYQAKLAGKNRFHIFDAEQDRNVRGRHEGLERIRLALDREEFVLHYQPKVHMRSGQVVGVEALIRWQHPENGLLPPMAFLPLVENHVLSVELGKWVIDAALAQMEAWLAAGLEIPVSVNVAAGQLQAEDFVSGLRASLASHPAVKPSSLVLEVLETSALEDIQQVSAVIRACREFDVRFALDDFGTGYSSLTYLRHLPASQLKIDRSFVSDMLHDPDDLAILEGVLGMATAFRREVIAEGVESVAHGEMLLLLGCELGQGYAISRPMPAADLPGWVADWRPDPVWQRAFPLSRDDLPLLLSSVEHRAWVHAVERHLSGDWDAPPPPDESRCRFGRWMEHQGRNMYGDSPTFQDIEPLHRRIHDLTEELLVLRERGRSADAVARLGELHDLRDQLLALLKTMLGESRKQGG